jgi:hypothetical protein
MCASGRIKSKERMASQCSKPDCRLKSFHSGLCFTHYKESQGFTYDPEKKLFVRPTKEQHHGD